MSSYSKSIGEKKPSLIEPYLDDSDMSLNNVIEEGRINEGNKRSEIGFDTQGTVELKRHAEIESSIGELIKYIVDLYTNKVNEGDLFYYIQKGRYIREEILPTYDDDFVEYEDRKSTRLNSSH